MWGALSSGVRAERVGSRQDYVVNGEPAGPGDVHGTVAIAFLDQDAARGGFEPRALYSGQWCSGVLIAPAVVLTAAHCLEQCDWRTCQVPDEEPYDCYWCDPEPWPAARIRVVAGARTLDDLWDAEVMPVQARFVPSEYVSSAQWAWTIEAGRCDTSDPERYLCEEPGLSPDIHDIAVLLLDAPLTAVDAVPVLANADAATGQTGIATGYGLRTERGSDELLTQDRFLSILHRTATPIEEVAENEVLTVAGENDSGVCFGDSGGPLYVHRDGGVFVAGVASRFRADREAPLCQIGTIYTSPSAHVDWIYDKAPQAIPFRIGGGGGCSAAASAGGGPDLLLLGLLLILLCRHAIRKKSSGAALALFVVSLTGCGSSDVSLCNETYDPTGFFCDPGFEVIDLRTAEASARSEVPDDALLYMTRSSNGGFLDPDGRAEAWHFLYYLPERRELPEAELIQVTAYPERTFVGEPLVERVTCIPTDPIGTLDSRQLTHDAIQFMESHGIEVRLGDGGNLLIVQHHPCRGFDELRNYVVFRSHAAYFDADGVFRSLDALPWEIDR